MTAPPDRQARGLLITGTDTSCGKTVVTAALLRVLRRQGQAVQVCKPVATGAERVAGQLLSEDTRILAEAGGLDAGQVTFWTYAEPAAPPVAARLAGQRLELEPIARAVRQQFQPGCLTLVEGVGGLLCPLTDRETVADLAERLGLPLVVVARRSLGTLNHTLLTLEVAQARGLAVAGVVVNETRPPDSEAEQTCIEELQKHTRVPVLAVVPFQHNPSEAEPASLADVDWWGLAGEAGSPEPSHE
jgi:dethiobiotin synthetase